MWKNTFMKSDIVMIRPAKVYFLSLITYYNVHQNIQKGKLIGKYIYTCSIYGSHGGYYEEYGFMERNAV
jgi:hypothetical protein